MPTPSECEAFWNEMTKKPYNPNDNGKSTKKKWLNEEGRMEFYECNNEPMNVERSFPVHPPLERTS